MYLKFFVLLLLFVFEIEFDFLFLLEDFGFFFILELELEDDFLVDCDWCFDVVGLVFFVVLDCSFLCCWLFLLLELEFLINIIKYDIYKLLVNLKNL